jgi:16S rRNA (cytosine1402-N4)-methyltransferase
LLQQSLSVMKSGGRIAIITFHSLEDRLVKNFFRNGTFSDAEIDQIYGVQQQKLFKIITKKPILANEDELKNNPRSRSAKLRIAEKINNLN